MMTTFFELASLDSGPLLSAEMLTMMPLYPTSLIARASLAPSTRSTHPSSASKFNSVTNSFRKSVNSANFLSSARSIPTTNLGLSPVSDQLGSSVGFRRFSPSLFNGLFSGGSRLWHVWVNHLLITALLAPLQVAVLRAVERKPSSLSGD